MNEFRFSIPQDILVGRGTAEKLGDAAKKLGGTHAFIISGPHLTKMGHVQHCADLLAAKGIPSDAFSETEGNPSVATVDKAAKAFKASGADQSRRRRREIRRQRHRLRRRRQSPRRHHPPHRHPDHRGHRL